MFTVAETGDHRDVHLLGGWISQYSQPGVVFALQGDIGQLDTFLFVPVGKGNATGTHWLQTGETANHPVIQKTRSIRPTWQ